MSPLLVAIAMQRLEASAQATAEGFDVLLIRSVGTGAVGSAREEAIERLLAPLSVQHLDVFLDR
jgi:hypothetical protein